MTRPIFSVAMATCTARYTHQSLVDEVLSGVDNKQGNHVPQERLEGGGARTIGCIKLQEMQDGSERRGRGGRGTHWNETDLVPKFLANFAQHLCGKESTECMPTTSTFTY